MATEAAMKVAREILNAGPDGSPQEGGEANLLHYLAAALDQHGAATARLAAEYAAVRFAKYQSETGALIEAAVQHAMEQGGQDE